MNHQYRQYSQIAGFTLVEMIVTVAILAIIAGMAAPSMQKQIQQAKIKTTANAFESNLREAQIQAVIAQRNTKVVFNSTSTQKNLKTFYESENTSTANPLTTYEIDKNVIITPVPTNLSAISFTANKKSYQGETISSTSTRMGQDSSGNPITTGFYVCLGKGTNRYLVTVDANNIIKSQINGSCS